MNPTIEIDLRGTSTERRRRLAAEALGGLRGGASLVVISDCDARQLANELRSACPDPLDLNVLEDSSDAHAVEVRRHCDQRTLPDLLEFEHARIDRLLAEVEWRLSQRLFGEALHRFDHLRTALEHHLLTEAQLLLPAYERSLGNAQAIATMRREHDIMRALLAEAALGFRHQDEEARSTVCALADLRELFGPHARREEDELARRLPKEDAHRLLVQLDGQHSL